MKTLVLANQKGGVGKTAIACQLGYFLVELLKKRVLIIDLDHQGNDQPRATSRDQKERCRRSRSSLAHG